MKVELIQVKQARVGFSSDALFSLLKKTLKAYLPKKYRKKRLILELVWVNDHEIKKLNKQYRAKNKPTDVLSFSYVNQIDPKSHEDQLFGQVVISVDTLRKQAKMQGHAYKTEAEVLFVHGVLHILGFDHERPTDLKKMLSAERTILGDKSGLISRASAE